MLSNKVTTRCILPIGHGVGPTVTLNSNFATTLESEIVSVRVKELFEPIVYSENTRPVFALFKSIFSWETDLWVTLGDFTVKKKRNWEGKSIFNWKSIVIETKYGVRQINQNHYVTCVQKDIYESNFN